MKPYVRPKTAAVAPQPPLLDGAPPFHGDPVRHPVHGVGTYAWSDWVNSEGAWVQPLERRADDGLWKAHVTTERGGFTCPITELRRA